MPDQSEIIQKLSVPRYAPILEPLPIPEPLWNAAPLLCLQVNDEWVSHILGVMIALDQPDAWIGNEDEVYAARQQVNEIMLAFMEVCGDMSDCNCDQPMFRIDENGVFQQSDDGGVIWYDAPTKDPRNSIPRIPPYPPSDTDNAICIYADSIVNHFKEGFLDVLEEGQSVETVLGFLTGIAEAIFGPLTGPIGWVVPALFAIATAIVAIGLAVITAEFTDTVWDKLRCLISENMAADGSMTATQTSAIYDGISTVSADIPVQTLLRSWIAAIGATGMTNAAHLGMGMTGAVCCPDCDPLLWTIWDGEENYGTVVEYGTNYVTIDLMSAPSTVGEYYGRMKTDDVATCCTIAGWEVLSGGTLNISAGGACGEAQTGGGGLSISETVPSGPFNRFAFGATGPCRVKITFQ